MAYDDLWKHHLVRSCLCDCGPSLQPCLLLSKTQRAMVLQHGHTLHLTYIHGDMCKCVLSAKYVSHV